MVDGVSGKDQHIAGHLPGAWRRSGEEGGADFEPEGPEALRPQPAPAAFRSKGRSQLQIGEDVRQLNIHFEKARNIFI